MVGARSLTGNPCDGHRLAAQLEQTNTLLQDIGTKPTKAIVDLGYLGVDADCAPVQVIHRGKYKSLTATQRTWLKRRQAIEPAIGHAKADHRMNRFWLKGGEGDALHSVLCAAGHRSPGREGHFFGLQFCGAVGRNCRAGGDARHDDPTTRGAISHAA